MFSCEIYEIFKNMLFYRISPVAAPDNALCEEILQQAVSVTLPTSEQKPVFSICNTFMNWDTNKLIVLYVTNGVNRSLVIQNLVLKLTSIKKDPGLLIQKFVLWLIDPSLVIPKLVLNFSGQGRSCEVRIHW